MSPQEIRLEKASLLAWLQEACLGETLVQGSRWGMYAAYLGSPQGLVVVAAPTLRPLHPGWNTPPGAWLHIPHSSLALKASLFYWAKLWPAWT